MRRYPTLGLLFLIAMIAGACAQAEPTPTPTATSTSVPTFTPTPTSTSTPVPTPTPVPTSTPTPAPTLVPSPTRVPASLTREPVELDNAQTTINGSHPKGRSGRSVAIGDLNNDGITDLIIGADRTEVDGLRSVGKAYVILGPLGVGTLDLETEADITVNGAGEHHRFGTGVSGGDVNDDGVDDLILSSPRANPGGVQNAGATYVFFGPLSEGRLALSTADVIIIGTNSFTEAASALAAGDANNDGVTDLDISSRGSRSPSEKHGWRVFGGMMGPAQ